MWDVPQAMLDERRRLDLDRRDEMWEGELHMTPPADSEHGRMAGRLLSRFVPVADGLGLEAGSEVGVWATGAEPESYRVPDLVVTDADRLSERGVEAGDGALLVVEIRSPRDETYEKLPFYDRVGVTEVLVVDRPEGVLKRFARRDGALVEATPVGGAHACSLDTLPGVVVRLDPQQSPGLVIDVA
jgi:Uma2 family endonuclease